VIARLFFAGLVILALAQLWVRLAPLPEARLTARPGPEAPGHYPLPGGITRVIALEDLPEDAFDRLLVLAAASPRTRRLGQGRDPAAFVTRSWFWGFPDIATIWVAQGNLHIHSHLVFGRGDFGVNAARVEGWLARLTDPA